MQDKSDEGDLYRRGRNPEYRLAWDRKRDGTLRSPYLQIIWYDAKSGRQRSRSTGQTDVLAAEQALDAFYVQRERGAAICPTCKRPLDDRKPITVVLAIQNYLAGRGNRSSIASMRPRLGHVLAWLDETGQNDMACDDVNEDVIDAFRDWAIEVPIITPTGIQKARTPSTVEASVRQWRAAINYAFERRDTLYPPAFKAKPPSAVDNSPTYRASVADLARMFAYCLTPEKQAGDTPKIYAHRKRLREPLLRYLQLAVATWARPDAVHDFSTAPERRQWIASARVIQLNPKGRPQTRKYRPAVPIGERMSALINQAPVGYYVGVDSVSQAFDAMLNSLGLPRDHETGLKTIRRSMSTIARNRLGEDRQAQWERMLGHKTSSSSDIYALMEMTNMGAVLAATNEIIEEIEALAPGAFKVPNTGDSPDLKIVNGGKNG